GAWKIYDRESLDFGMRTSCSVAAYTDELFVNNPEIGQAARVLYEALTALVGKEDADAAEQKLRPVARVKLPARLEAVRWQVLGRIELRRGRFQQALDAFDRGVALRQDTPTLDLLRGITLNRLGKWDAALNQLE